MQRVRAWGRSKVSTSVDRVRLIADGQALQLNREMSRAFPAHFCDHFARCPDLLVQKFRSYLADFPRLREAEVAGCVGLVTEYEVRDALKQIDLNKSPGLDGLPYKCTWGCRTCLSLFWRINSKIGYPRDPSLEALPRVWPHRWRKVAGMFGRT